MKDYQLLLKQVNKIDEERKASAGKYLKAIAGQFNQGAVEFQTEVLVGRPADSLIDYIEANDIDLILIATHGRSGVGRWIRGSVAEKILRASRAPVLMVRAPGTMNDRRD